MGKWDPASKIINDVRAAFFEADQMFRQFGLEHTYNDLGALLRGIEEKQLPPRIATTLTLVFRDWAPLAFWNQHKQVYTMHPGLTEGLDATDIKDPIPGEELQKLPHPDPLFVLPRGVPVTFKGEEPGRLIAIQISGAVISRPGHAQITSTLDPNANGLYIHALAEVLDDQNNVIDWDFCHTSIPFGEIFTIEGLINHTRDHYSVRGDGISEGLTDEGALAYVRSVVGIALSHVLYVVARNAEIASPCLATTAQTKQAKRMQPRVQRPVKHQPVGYVIGAALDAARRNEANATGNAGTGERTVKGHWRKAHFHTVRYGKGRALSYIDWFPPIPVKIDGPAAVPTLHPY